MTNVYPFCQTNSVLVNDVRHNARHMEQISNNINLVEVISVRIQIFKDWPCLFGLRVITMATSRKYTQKSLFTYRTHKEP